MGEIFSNYSENLVYHCAFRTEVSQNMTQSFLNFPVCSMAKNGNLETPEISSKLCKAEGTHC